MAKLHFSFVINEGSIIWNVIYASWFHKPLLYALFFSQIKETKDEEGMSWQGDVNHSSIWRYMIIIFTSLKYLILKWENSFATMAICSACNYSLSLQTTLYSLRSRKRTEVCYIYLLEDWKNSRSFLQWKLPKECSL